MAIPAQVPHFLNGKPETAQDWNAMVRWFQQITPATGTGTQGLGTNCPAQNPATPFEWQECRCSDGSLGYFAVYK